MKFPTKKAEQLIKIIENLGAKEIERTYKLTRHILGDWIITIPLYINITTIVFLNNTKTEQELVFHSLRKKYVVQIAEFKEYIEQHFQQNLDK